MLLKGCSRRVIMVRDTKSPYFDSVYFILRSSLPGNARDGDMLRAAKALIEPEVSRAREAEQNRSSRARSRRADTICAFFAGAATVAFSIGLIALAAWLLY